MDSLALEGMRKILSKDTELCKAEGWPQYPQIATIVSGVTLRRLPHLPQRNSIISCLWDEESMTLLLTLF
jgi:hypothetical protein